MLLFLGFYFSKFFVGKILCKYSKQKIKCTLNTGKCVNLKEMSVWWVKQSEVSREPVPEEPTINVEKHKCLLATVS